MPERADLPGRAMRLIADGLLEREGVPDLARRLGCSERQLDRSLVEAFGAGTLQLARAQRAQTARVLLETTGLPLDEVAVTAGFSSPRQLNATIREVFDRSPGQLRGGRPRAGEASSTAQGLALRLPFRAPLQAGALLGFLQARAVAGVEEAGAGFYRRSLALPRGDGVVEIALEADERLRCTFWLSDLRDLAPAIARCRRLLDLDCDPQEVLEGLGRDPVVGALVRAAPGLRVPGHTDGCELAVRAVLGQQISVVAAGRLAEHLVSNHGRRLAEPRGAITHLFPSPAELAELDPAQLPMPRARARSLVGLTGALARGELVLDAGGDREAELTRLRALDGIGPWTAGYVAMRALRDPDAMPAGDLGLRRALVGLGHPGDARTLASVSRRWSPHRAYGAQHLWAFDASRAAAMRASAPAGAHAPALVA